MTGRGDLRTIEAVAPNISRRYSGVTTTILSVVPHQNRRMRMGTLGEQPLPQVPIIGWLQILRHGWTLPPGRQFRIWHARRNIEMIVGIILRDLLRQPWKIVFTSAAQRDHSNYTKWLIRQMDAVIAASPEAARYLEVPATVISHGVDVGTYRPAQDRNADWAGTGLSGKYGIAVLGRVRHQKGTDIFVEAMRRLLPRYPDFTAAVIGLVTNRHLPFYQSLRGRVERAGLAGRVLFLGELPHTEIPGWFRRILICVTPQRQEGFGLTPLEAMASGAVVVATKAGTFESQVIHEKTGLLVDADSADELTAAIERLLKDPELAARMGQAGRAHVTANFAVEGEAARICDVYEGLWRGETVHVRTENGRKFRFRPEDLRVAERTPGISAFMRIRNGAEFLEATIRSHIPYFDEIVAVHNRCTDATPEILEQLAKEFGPEKLRIYHYEPEVFPPGSEGHRNEPADSPRSLVNYYNYALAKTRFTYATKLDDDHIAIEPALADITARIRAGEFAPDEMICFSGPNLARGQNGEIGILVQDPLSGSGDIGFFPVGKGTYFVHDRRFERFRRSGLKRRFGGFLYWHLKYMKADFGFANYDLAQNPNSRYARRFATFDQLRAVVPVNEIGRLVTLDDRILMALRRSGFTLPGKLSIRTDRWLNADGLGTTLRTDNRIREIIDI